MVSRGNIPAGYIGSDVDVLDIPGFARNVNFETENVNAWKFMEWRLQYGH